MLIFIYGDDAFRAQEKVRTMKEAFTKKFDPTGMNTAEFTGKLSPGEVIGAARALPFLGQKRLVIIRDLIANTNKADAQVWIDGLNETPESSIVIFWESASPGSIEKKALFKELSKAADTHAYPFPVLQGHHLNKWVVNRVAARGGSIGRQALRSLIERVGPELWQMDHEVKKLVAYAQGEQITIKMVEDLVHASFEGKIFDLIDAISQQKSKRAIQLLKEERLSGANDHYLLTMLGRQVRLLLGARSLLDENPHATKQEFAQVMSIHPFVAQKAMHQAKGFTTEKLKHVHDQLFTFDIYLKTGRIQPDLAVDLTTVELMN